MRFQSVGERWHALCTRISSILIAFRSVLRGLSLFLSERPRTTLRVLCIMAFDTLYMLRNAKPLPRRKLRTLAALLDFGACANAAFDNKHCCPHEWRRTQQLLEEAGIQASVVEYLRRLWDLESTRPLPGRDNGRFQEVALYREAVVRLSLGMVAAAANGGQSLYQGIRSTYCEADLNILFRTAMQCQIMDDVLDYREDLSGGFPSFLTALESLPQAFEHTRLAALGYADARALPRTGALFPFRSALFLVSTCAKLVIVVRRWRLYSRNRHTGIHQSSDIGE
jgi:hypothetical protein